MDIPCDKFGVCLAKIFHGAHKSMSREKYIWIVVRHTIMRLIDFHCISYLTKPGRYVVIALSELNKDS